MMSLHLGLKTQIGYNNELQLHRVKFLLGYLNFDLSV